MSGLAFENGCAKVLGNNEEWADAFYAIAATLLARNGHYTTDEATEIIGSPPGHANAVGAAAVAFARKHGLEITGYRKTSRDSRRTARIAIWSKV